MSLVQKNRPHRLCVSHKTMSAERATGTRGSKTTANDPNLDTQSDDVYDTNHLAPPQASQTRKHRTSAMIEGTPCDMEVDSGSELSIISEKTNEKIMKKMLYRVSHFNRKSDFHCNTVQIKGVYKVHVKHGSFEGDLKLKRHGDSG